MVVLPVPQVKSVWELVNKEMVRLHPESDSACLVGA